MQYVVRFQRTPTAYTRREALIVEAEDPVAAVMVVRDYLLQRGDNPAGYVPDVGWHLSQLAGLRRDGAAHTSVAFQSTVRDKGLQAALEWHTSYHQQKIEEEVAEYVDEYVPAPGRVIGPTYP